MRRHRSSKWFVLYLTVCALVSAPALAADEETAPPPKPPELKVLDKLAGKWNFESFSKVAVWNPTERHVTGTLTRQWVLDGRFLQEKSIDLNRLESIVTFTYDAGKKLYRIWHFSSHGWSSDSTGTWDEASQTLRLHADLDNGITSSGSIHFIDQDTHEWNGVVKDATGKVYFDGGGKMVRQK